MLFPRFKNCNQGFTLLEMMVVIAIMTIMTGVLVGNLPQFRDHTSLSLIAQEVAIDIRQAQVFGIGTKVSGATAFLGHGIFFCDPSVPGCHKNFLLYSDERQSGGGGNRYFDSSPYFPPSSGTWAAACQTDSNGECQEVYELAGNIEICKLEVEPTPGNWTDAPELHLTFSRLYPDAIIKDQSNLTTSRTDSHRAARITIRSTRDNAQRQITVYNTGSVVISAVPSNTPVCSP